MNPIAEILTEELKQRQLKNKNYSLRAFARALELEPSALSKILKEQRIPSEKTLQKVCEKLNWEAEKMNSLKSWAQKKESPSPADYKPFDGEQFEHQMELYHVVMLEALRLPRFSESLEDLRQTMGMEIRLFYQALEELEKMNMLQYQKSAQRVRILREHNTTLPLALTSEKLRALQKRFLGLAMRALDQVPIEQRENTTLTVAIPSKRLKDFKAFMAKVRRKISADADKHKAKADSVYNFTFAIYPVVKKP